MGQWERPLGRRDSSPQQLNWSSYYPCPVSGHMVEREGGGSSTDRGLFEGIEINNESPEDNNRRRERETMDI